VSGGRFKILPTLLIPYVTKYLLWCWGLAALVNASGSWDTTDKQFTAVITLETTL
jgi:hypothetical protein